MSKRNKTQTGGAVCKEGVASTVGGAIQAISESTDKIDGLSQTGNFTPLMHLVCIIARNFKHNRQGKCKQEEETALAKAFTNAVSTLHNAVFDREAASLFALRSGYEKWTPLTQCLCTASSPAMRHRLKVELLSLIHTAADIESAEPDLTRSTLADALLQATDTYERLRRGHRWGSSQIIIAYLNVLETIARAGSRLDGGEGFILELKGVVGFEYEDICWFEMPDLPESKDPEIVKRFISASISEIDKRVKLLCEARPEPFLATLYQFANCATTCIRESLRFEPKCEKQVFSVLARSISRIHERLDSDLDLVDCVLGHLTVPTGDCSRYSYPMVVERMRRLALQCVKANAECARELLPKNFRECTRLFCLACNFEWRNRWDLGILYDDLIADMWGRAKELAGEEVCDE